MNRWAVLLMIVVAPLSRAQVAIENPQHLPFSEQRAEVLHEIVTRVVAEEFHVRPEKLVSPVTLVLGEDRERTLVDQANGTFTIYLKHWDEETFAASDMQLTMQRMLTRDRWERMARDVIRRSQSVAPISASNLK